MANNNEKKNVFIYKGKVDIKVAAASFAKLAKDIVAFLFINNIKDDQNKAITMNSMLDANILELLCLQYGFDFKNDEFINTTKLVQNFDSIDPKLLVSRPPVISIMGHVDHGKTTLIDYLRKTRVAEREVGGITQSVGTYQIEHLGKLITVLDTPGHEAFQEMRKRGANIADIVVLVVAADDGIKEQTIEAIKHAKSAGIEIIVAINKIDKVGEHSAEVDKVKQALSQYELVSEDYGGSTITVPISAKHGVNIDLLMENIITLAEIKELKANPHDKASGHVIEAKIDRGKGILTSILVQNGTLEIGEYIVVGEQYGRIRNMYDDLGNQLTKVTASTPLRFSGLSSLPFAGDSFKTFSTEREAKDVAEYRKNNADQISDNVAIDESKQIVNVIIKADTQGSAEAAKNSLQKLQNKDVQVRVVRYMAGDVTDDDIAFASTAKAIVYLYRIKPNSQTAIKIRNAQIEVRYHDVIYHMVEELSNEIDSLIKPEYQERKLGTAEILKIIDISRIGRVAGCRVVDGVIRNKLIARVYRKGKLLYETKIESLKIIKDEVREVRTGFECGIMLKNTDFAEGDFIECFDMEEI